MTDVGVRASYAPVSGSTLPFSYAKYIARGWINCTDHAERDGLSPGVATLGTLVRTLNDGMVWEVASVGPVVYAPWSAGSSGSLLVFQTIADVIAHDFTGAPNGTLISVARFDELYALFTAPSAAVLAATDGIAIIQPTTPNTTRVVQRGLAVSYGANYYINASTGNDTNDGSSGAPWATTNRLGHLLSPGGARFTIKQDTAIHIAAGTYDALDLNLAWDVGASFLFDIFCDYTSSAPITLNSVTNTVETTSPVRGRITTLSGAFVDKKRIRSTSGANIGAITYSTGLNSATDTFVKTWFMESSFSVVNIANGTTCVVDTLGVSIKRVSIRALGQPAFPVAVRIHDAILPNGADFQNDVSGASNFILSQCEVSDTSGNSRLNGIVNLRNCRIPGTTSVFNKTHAILFGCAIEGFQSASENTLWATGTGCCFNGGSVGINTQAIVQLSAAEWVNALTSQPAISFSTAGGILVLFGQQYGFGASWAVGVRCNIAGLIAVIMTAASQLAIPATAQIQISGKNYLYSNVPFAISRLAIVFALSTDAAAISTLPNVVGVTLSDVQTATDIIASPAPGPQYVFKVDLEILIAGTAGKIIVNEIHTSPSGTTFTTPVTAPIDITAAGNVGFGVIPISVDGSSAVRYSVTAAPGTFTKGSLSYALKISVTQEPN